MGVLENWIDISKAAAPAAICTLTSIGTYVGVSYTIANTVAAVAVATTVTAAAIYAGDIAYLSVTGKSPLKIQYFEEMKRPITLD